MSARCEDRSPFCSFPQGLDKHYYDKCYKLLSRTDDSQETEVRLMCEMTTKRPTLHTELADACIFDVILADAKRVMLLVLGLV